MARFALQRCGCGVHSALPFRGPGRRPNSRNRRARAGGGMVDFQAVRRAMVDGQVRTNDVTNLGLIDAMLEIPREAFVPAHLAALAYLDRDIELQAGNGAARYLLKPVVTARLIQAADIGTTDRVL